MEGGEGGKEGVKGREREGVGRGNWCPLPHGATTCLRHAPASIATAEKHPLSYQTQQSVHMIRNCGAQTLPLTMHYGGKNMGENRGRNGQILTPNERVLTVGVPVYGVKFHQNLATIATVREVTDRQTDRRG